MKSIGWRVAELRPIEVFHSCTRHRRPETGDQRPDTQVILYSVQRCYAVHWTDNYLFRPWGPRATGDPVTRRSNIPIVTPVVYVSRDERFTTSEACSADWHKLKEPQHRSRPLYELQDNGPGDSIVWLTSAKVWLSNLFDTKYLRKPPCQEHAK